MSKLVPPTSVFVGQDDSYTYQQEVVVRKDVLNIKLSEINYVCCVPDYRTLPSVVYKYRGINELLYKSLILNQVWLAKPESFNDPFEPERLFSGTLFSKALERSVREAGVLCLCKSSSNLPMWSYYGDGLRGVTLGYDLEALLASLEPVEKSINDPSPRWKYVFDLDYCDAGFSEIDEMALLRNDHLTDAVRQKMFATKSQAFLHEQECRIVVQPSPDSNPAFSWHGDGLYRHAPDALREIVFGELIADKDRQAIMQAVAGRKVVFMEAARDKNNFKINIASY